MSNIITDTSVAYDVSTILSGAGLGVLGTDLFLHREPDSPNNCVTIYGTGQWKQPEIDYNYEYPSVQVRVRRKAGDYKRGELEVMMRMNALHGYVGTIGSTKYHVIIVTNGPIYMGEDGSGRPRWVFNCEIHRSK